MTDSHQSIKSLVLKYASSKCSRSIFEYTLTLLLFALNSYFLWVTINNSSLLMIPLMCIQALMIIRVFILQHDCGHYALFKNRRVNTMAGVFCSFITPFSFHYWRDAHAVHHRINGNLSDRPWIGDIDLLTTEEFNQRSPKEKMIYTIKRNMWVLILFGWLYHFYTHSIHIPKNNRKLLSPKKFVRFYALFFLKLIIYVFLIVFTSWEYFCLALIVPTILAYATGIFLFYVQHNFETSYFYQQADLQSGKEAVWLKSATAGSTCLLLPPILRWFTGNIGYHHIHHISPKVPFYYLKKIYDTHPELQDVYQLTLATALKQFSYKLYDPASQKMVTWRDYRQLSLKRQYSS